MNYKVLITTSGIGSRLGDITDYTNKSLVRIGKKPAICHIINSYPKDVNFIITLGHFADNVKDFLALSYPDRKFEYVRVPKYQGPGSSLGLSMLVAKKSLQCPFIYHAGDTLVTEPVPEPQENWIGFFRGGDTSQYASWTVQEGKLQLHEKGAIDNNFLHIGLVGIKNYKVFWESLEKLYKLNPNNQTLNDCQVIDVMIDEGYSVSLFEFKNWYDIGNVDALQTTRKKVGNSLGDLSKIGEDVFIFDDFVIKFFSDSEIVSNRFKRGKILKGFVPEVEEIKGNFYKYEYVKGDLYSEVIQPEDFSNFLNWVQTKFWKKEEKYTDKDKFIKVCNNFYYKKTQSRISQFLEKNRLQDTEHYINGQKVPKIEKMLEIIDSDFISNGLQSNFHGDFILENIIRTKKGYCFIDWRQDFGGLTRSGDRYYDLAKLNHNLTVNHGMVNENLFSIEMKGENILVDILRPDILVECQKIFFQFLDKENYDKHKVEIITALVWLNMAPLHHHPFNIFLYYFGKLKLWRALKLEKGN